MALDRQSIEKRDFPVGRSGYDPDAVDAHLAALADEIADFKRSARHRSDTLASSASEQVRAIVEAAETSAREIQREAENIASEIREEATTEARGTRDQASDEAREYVGKVSEATATALERLSTMETELSGLIESLRDGATRLDADLHRLEGDLAEVGQAAAHNARPPFEPEPVSAPADEAQGASEESAQAEADLGWGTPAPAEEPAQDEAGSGWGAPAAPEESTGAESTGDEAGPGWGAPAEPEESTSEQAGSGWGTPLEDAETESPAGNGFQPQGGYTEEPQFGYTEEPEPASQAEAPDDAEGARLIALNMALNGTPRDETSRYLSENFRLADRDGLLDEVYASVEG